MGKWSALTCDLPAGVNREAWVRWAQARSARRKPISELAAHGQWEMLLRYDQETQAEIVKYSIDGDYQGLFPPKAKKAEEKSFIERHTDRAWAEGLDEFCAARGSIRGVKAAGKPPACSDSSVVATVGPGGAEIYSESGAEALGDKS